MVEHAAVLSEGEPADAPLAIGNLPDGWRPVQPVHIRLKNGRDRLYFWVHAVSVVAEPGVADDLEQKVAVPSFINQRALGCLLTGSPAPESPARRRTAPLRSIPGAVETPVGRLREI